MPLHQREITNSGFGPGSSVNMGDFHVHGNLVHRPAQPSKRQAVCIIPYPRNNNRVHRPELVKKVKTLLISDKKDVSAALWGLPGSGKTQLALEHAYEYFDLHKDSCSVFWVHADNETTFVQDYRRIGAKLGVDKSLAPDLFLEAVRDEIEACDEWLLVLDNVDDLTMFGVDQSKSGTRTMESFLPQDTCGTILWTSRDGRISELVGLGQAIHVNDGMKDSEAKELLAKSMQTTVVDLEDSPDLDILIEELHSLPLALSQAGAFMRRTNTPISEYYAMMQQRMERWDLLTASQLDPHRRRNLPNSILQTWGISMERIRKECLTAYRIIHIVAYVENQNIPFKVMLAASGTDNVVEVKSALARLRDFSFVGFQNEDGERNYEMHKLVQEASRFGLNVAKHDAQWFVDQIPATEPYIVSLAFEVADRTFPTSNPSTWGECGLYLPHALQAFEWALLVGDDDVHIEAAKSALSDRIMHFFHERGRWVERERLSNQMLDLRSRILGEKHPGTLQSMEDLEVTLIRMRRFEEAQGIAERELDLRIKVLGERDPRTLRSMANLATTWTAQGRYDESEKAFDKVWQVRRKVLGVKHQETIRAMLDLGTVYRLQGHLKESESLTTRGLKEWTEVMGEDHPDPIYAKFMLAQVWHDMDRKQDSFTLANECLGLQCRVLGKEHPMTLKTARWLKEKVV